MHTTKPRVSILVAMVVLAFLSACTPTPQDQLFDSVETGDFEAFHEALDLGADINAVDKDGRTALALAVAGGDTTMVGLLTIVSGIDMNATDDEGWTVLTRAAADGDLPMIATLTRGHYGFDVDAMNSDGRNALMLVTALGRLDIVEHLVEEADVDITIANSEGSTAFSIAQDNSHAEIARFLLKTLYRIGSDWWVDSHVGLRFREEPDLASETIAVLPYATRVYVEGRSRIEQEIGGVTGKWVLAEWEGQQGWLFGAYMSEERIIPFDVGIPYVASHFSGRKYTDAISVVDLELLFLPDNAVRYTSHQSSFGGSTRTTHAGTYEIRSGQMHLNLSDGVERGRADDPGFPPDVEKPEPTVPGFTLVLVWLEHVDGFLEADYYSTVFKGDYYELNREKRQYQLDTDESFDYIGYFALQAGFQVGNIGPAGGVVFYDKGTYSDGWRYLEAAWSDHPDGVAWGPVGTEIGNTNTDIGSGMTNTETITTALDSAGYAARWCYDLELGGYEDWFLPSKDELGLIWDQHEMIGGFRPWRNDYPAYWSSSESGESNAWYQLMDNGSARDDFVGKDHKLEVRPIRAF